MSHPPRRPGALDRRTRAAMALAALGLAVVLGLARWLEPDPKGYGTHQQLGLAPCAFERLTGRRCPTCGMTTAFAWVARGRLDRAWRANPAGVALAPAVAALVPWLLAGAARGRLLGARSLDRAVTLLLVAAATLTLAAWTVRTILEGGG